jgi:hypothetical protein
MTDPSPAQRETLAALATEVANMATELAEHIHRLSDADMGGSESVMDLNVNTTRALWARDALSPILASLRNDNP